MTEPTHSWSSSDFDKSDSVNILTRTISPPCFKSKKRSFVMDAQTGDRTSEGVCLAPFKTSKSDTIADWTFSEATGQKCSKDKCFGGGYHTGKFSNICNQDLNHQSGEMVRCCNKSGWPLLSEGCVDDSFTSRSIAVRARNLDVMAAIPVSAKPTSKRRNQGNYLEEINLLDAEKWRVQEEGDEEANRQQEILESSAYKLDSPIAGNSADKESLLSRDSLALSASSTQEKSAQEKEQGLQLVSLLLNCATAVAKNERHTAGLILEEIYKRAEMYGDAMQRLSAYFAESLAARLVLKDSPLYKTLIPQPSPQELFRAFAALHKVSPCFQFAHFTSNQIILEAFEGHQILHVIDINMARGFQWASLLQSLAARPEGPPRLLRVTGVGRSEEMLHETAHRLSNFARNVNICFEFQAIVECRLENLRLETLVGRPGEAIAVNCVFELHRLLNDPSGRKISLFISKMRRLRPTVVTIVEQEANHNAPSFLGRFMEALHYYAAIFDSLDASFPQQSDDRLRIEQVFFARQIKNIVACEDAERIERHERSESWKQRMEKAGFELMHLSDHAISQAKLLLQFFPCEGYRLTEKGGLLSLGWQERQLITASAWTLPRPLQSSSSPMMLPCGTLKFKEPFCFG